MSNSVSTLISGIKSKIATELPTYKELPYVFDLSKNSYKGNENRYGVTSGSASELSGTIRAVTLSQEFQVILTDNYVINNGDSGLQSKVQGLQDKCFDLYKALLNSKCSSPTICINVSDYSLDNPEIIDQDKAIVQKFSFQVQYRQNL